MRTSVTRPRSERCARLLVQSTGASFLRKSQRSPGKPSESTVIIARDIEEFIKAVARTT
jgi:hypothetical protein